MVPENCSWQLSIECAWGGTLMLVDMLQNLLKSIARMPETSIWRLPLVTLEERRHLQKFEVTPAIAAQLPDEIRQDLENQSTWPLCLDGNQQQMPLGVRGRYLSPSQQCHPAKSFELSLSILYSCCHSLFDEQYEICVAPVPRQQPATDAPRLTV